MEEIIKLRKSNCKNCYKCIRGCPVKSIAFKDGQAQIIDDECVYCGSCLLICPQNAKYVTSDLGRVRAAVKAGDRLYVSLAPSYIAAFPGTGILRISSALRQLGFARAEETAIGAAQVTREYDRLIRAHKMRNIITTSCPSVNLLVEKYYPDLIPQLAPVVTPAVAHARMIKQIYGARAKVVFIGPCIAKKFERADPDNGGAIWAVLTFDELRDWFADEKVDLSLPDPDARAMANTLPRFYPAPGGILRNLAHEDRRRYERMSVDGLDRCMEILDSIRRDGLSGYFLEMDACPGGCLGGPVLRMMREPFLRAKDALIANVKSTGEAPPALTENVGAPFAKRFHGRAVKRPEPDEAKIREVLALTGKTAPEMELNCGCCGYNTCREKAIAVIEGKADINMCVPYMRELAESFSNTVVEHTPTGILITDDRLKIKQINPAAARMLGLDQGDIGRSVTDILPSGDFEKAIGGDKRVLSRKTEYAGLGLTVEQSVIFVPDSRTVFVLIRDISEQERMLREQRRVTEETADFARQVVDKQMRVVQEIANMLGETTSETKTALSKLTKTVVTGSREDMNDEG
jgi:PAS domain S-box-containing protein